MAFTPDVPFPKSAGDPIRSKDWNDLVNEAKRLDTAKVERAGDAITGGLTIAGALAVGKAAASAGSKVDVAGGDLRINDNNLVLRGGTDNNHGLGWFGLGKLFAGLNVDGPALYGNSGGVLGTTNGGQKAALAWDVNGRVGIGVVPTNFKLEVADRVRLRQGSADSAGMWFHQNTPNSDRAFVGMWNDDMVGFWGNQGIGWGLSMHTTTGNTGLRIAPHPSVGLYLNPGAANGQPAMPYGLYITSGATVYGLYVGSDSYVAGRIRDQKVRTWSSGNNQISNAVANSWVDMPNMSSNFTLSGNASVQVTAQINGVQMQGSTTLGCWWRLLVDGNEVERTRNEWNNNGWELRGIYMHHFVNLGAGSHTVSVQWYVQSGTVTCCWYNDVRRLSVIEL